VRGGKDHDEYLGRSIDGVFPIANNFIEMNVPDDWACALYAGEQWTCIPMDPAKAKEAIVVFSFAEQSPADNMKLFYDYLNTSLTMINPVTKKTEKSVPKNMQYKDIQGQTWVDSLHLSHAVPNYYTRYLATMKDGRSVLVSVTVDKAKYNLYMSLLYKMVESMRLRVAAPAAPLETGLSGMLGQKIKETKEKKKTIPTPAPQEKSKLSAVILSVLAALIVFILFYRYMKKRKGNITRKRGGFFK
jgi:hypothetical protein